MLGAVLTEAMGSPKTLRAWARISAARFGAECASLEVTVAGEDSEGPEPKRRKLTPAEEGQVGEVLRLAVASLKGAGALPAAGVGRVQGMAAGEAATAASSLGSDVALQRQLDKLSWEQPPAAFSVTSVERTAAVETSLDWERSLEVVTIGSKVKI